MVYNDLAIQFSKTPQTRSLQFEIDCLSISFKGSN